MSHNATSSALLVQEKLLKIVDEMVAGKIDPEVVSSMVENYIQANGVSASSFVYDRGGVAASSWIIEHNLNKYPQISLMDDSGNQFEADVIYNSLNSLTVNFSRPISGKAVLS